MENKLTRGANTHNPLIILLLTTTFAIFFSQAFGGRNYYFSNSSGDDTRTSLQAQNPATPWKTIDKLNSYFINFQPGDSLLFKRNDVFYGSIIILKSGTDTAPIVFSAYGAGNKPVLTGFTTLANWTNEGNGIYSKALTAQSQPSMVSVNGVNTPMGRFPHSVYSTIESHTGNTSITNANLNSTVTNWTGAELVMRKDHWTIDRCLIVNHTGSTLNYLPSEYVADARDGYGFFIQNDLKCLSDFGDWCFKNGKLYMFFGASSPDAYTVNVSTLNRIISAEWDDYITVNNLALTGADNETVYINNSKNFTLQNCDIDFSGITGVLGFNLSPNITIQNNTINHCNNTAVFLDIFCNNAWVNNNTISNTGLIQGMGAITNVAYCAVHTKGMNTVVEYNDIENTGYIGINFQNNSSIVRYNFINNFCMVKDDGAGIYTAAVATGKAILNNIVINGIGAGTGTADGMNTASGIYIDDYGSNVNIAGNSLANLPLSGIYIHNANDVNICKNTIYNSGDQIRFSHDYSWSGNPVVNIVMKKNIFFSKTPDQYIFEQRSLINDIPSFCTADSNYYIRPFGDGIVSKLLYYVATKKFNEASTFSRWKALTDAHSFYAPVNVPDYTINSLIGSNKFPNGTFNANITGSSISYSGSGTVTRTWDNTNKINGGSLKVSFGTISTVSNEANLTIAVGALEAGKNYICRFSLLGDSANRSVGVYLRGASAPYTILTPRQYCSATTTRIDHEIVFSPTVSMTSAQIYFVFNDVGNAYIDNIELWEANVTMTTPDNILRFEYNETNTNKTIALDVPYLGYDGTSYAGSITLLPFTSAVLIKNPNQPPSIQNQNFTLIKNSPNGTVIGTVQASDPDAGQILTYSIVSGNTNAVFAINSSSGLLTLVNSNALNLLNVSSLTLVIKVQDNGTGQLSNQAVITVNMINPPSCTASGNITYQIWNNIGNSSAVSALTGNINFPNSPTSATLITSMEGTTNLADNFGARIAGYICAPATGNYTFWIASDDNSELWLSTNGLAANKQKIAFHTGWTNPREWNKFSTQKSAVVSLVQGQSYYIEALMKEAGGGDNLSVGWLKPGQTGLVPSEVVPGSVLSPLGSNQTVLVTSVTLSATASVTSGTSISIPSTVLPANAANSVLNWNSSNTAVATVNSNGLVTGITAGSATIVATSTDGSNKSGSCALTVIPPPVLVSSVSLPTTLSFDAGSAVTLQATILPANAANKTLNWTSSNTTVATVNSAGLVTGLIPGSATITATSTDGSNKSGNCSLTVNVPPILVSSVTVPATSSFNAGSAVTLQATVLPSNAANKTLSWTSSNIAVATVSSNGLVTGVSPGTSTITATSTDGSNKSGICSLIVNIPPILVTSVTLPVSSSFNSGSALTIPATVLPANAANSALAWSSSNTSIATVNSLGLVSGISPGNAIITATSTDGTNKTGTCALIVNIPVTSVTLPATSAFDAGSAVTLPATVLPANASNGTLTWTSSNVLVATVSGSGLVNGITPGSASIIATSTDGSNKTDTCLVTVNIPPCTASGNISYEVWNNIGNSSAVVALTSNINYPNNPTTVTLLTSLEGTTNLADNYGARIAGYICAPATGSYTFWIASDDNCELWLSTNTIAANKQKIAFHTGWTLPREWNKFTTQKSAVINLVQGKSYYIEALMKESGGGDNLAVGWLKPGQTGTAPSEVIPGSVLSPFTMPQAILVTTVSLPATATVNAGSSITISSSVLPANATNSALLWTSGNTSVATVNSNGIVTGISPGNAAITATSTDGSNKSGVCSITVNTPPILVTSVTLPATAAFDAGTSVTLTASVLPANATNSTISWSSSNTAVATVTSTGLVSGISPGVATITASSTDGSNKSGLCAVTVNIPPILVTAVSLPATSSFNAGTGITLTATVLPVNASNSTLSWTSSNTAVATVSNTGLVSGIAPGNATITATSTDGTNKSGICSVTVNVPPILVTSVALSATASFNAGSAITLTATVLPANAANSTLAWTSSNTSVATVNSSGLVTGILPGSATITATSTDGSNKSGVCLITVNTPPILVTSVSLPTASSVNAGSSVTLNSTVLPLNATNSVLVWTTSNTAVATVSNSGLVSGLIVGSATIIATSTDGSNKSGSCQVTVTTPPCTSTGNISYQIWNNIGNSSAVSSLTSNINYPNNPTSTTLINSLEGTTNLADFYGARIAGYICAPVTGNYTFWIAGDDNCELWLSTNDLDINKQKIAFHTGWTLPREWNKFTTQKSNVISLIQGHSYYIEALLKEASGGDNLSVGWLKPGQTGTVPSEVIPGSVLSPLGIKSVEVLFENPDVKNSDISLSVYPNPLNSDVLNLKIENLFSKATLKIYTVSGVEYYTGSVQSSGIVHIDRSEFKNGVYVIKLYNDHFVKTIKLIVN